MCSWVVSLFGGLLICCASAAAFDVVEVPIQTLADAQEAGEVTARDLVQSYLARIAAYDRTGPHLNAIVTLNGSALMEADVLDRERGAKKIRGPLHGIPLLIKDNFDIVGM